MANREINNSMGKPTDEREVLLVEALRANASENSKASDYTFRFFSDRKFFLEAKKPSVAVDTNFDNAKQVRRYGFTTKPKFFTFSKKAFQETTFGIGLMKTILKELGV